MGMSLEIRETPFGKSFGHGGNNGDFKCKFEVYKDQKMGYALFTNSNTSDALLENLRKFLIEGRGQTLMLVAHTRSSAQRVPRGVSVIGDPPVISS